MTKTDRMMVLNLIINGLPSIQKEAERRMDSIIVLNLIINGLPSIHWIITIWISYTEVSFKPYYKWITFNTIFYLVISHSCNP